METIPMSKFKATCSAVLNDVNVRKKRVIITKRGKPIAEIVPVIEVQTDIALKETVLFMGDIISPVAQEDWEASPGSG